MIIVLKSQIPRILHDFGVQFARLGLLSLPLRSQPRGQLRVEGFYDRIRRAPGATLIRGFPFILQPISLSQSLVISRDLSHSARHALVTGRRHIPVRWPRPVPSSTLLEHPQLTPLPNSEMHAKLLTGYMSAGGAMLECPGPRPMFICAYIEEERAASFDR